MIYVTFLSKEGIFPNIVKKHYAVECKNRLQALDIANDLNSRVGIHYIRINTRGRIPQKRKILNPKNYFKQL